MHKNSYLVYFTMLYRLANLYHKLKRHMEKKHQLYNFSNKYKSCSPKNSNWTRTVNPTGLAQNIKNTLQKILLPVSSFSLTEATRTVTFDNKGSEIVLSKTQMKRGKFLFSKACAACHIGGLTKPDPNIGLDLKSLAGALPRRDNIEKIVEFLLFPYSYDGLTPIVERHYCTELAWEYAKMRSLTRPDLVTIAGHILLSAKLLGPKWGGGKVYY